MSIDAVNSEFTWFESFVNFERSPVEAGEYRLDRMAKMLDFFANPHFCTPCIHIAGSKGKGSIAHHIAVMAKSLGLRVGVYASPHLVDYRERIYSGEGFFADPLYLEAIERIKSFVSSSTLDQWGLGQPTCFELLTLCAFLVFESAQLDLMIIETGLGGRLDASNLVNPEVCVISLLELEHTDILGPRIEDIAREKAGIFKSGAHLLSAEQVISAHQVLDRKASELGTKVEYVKTQIERNPAKTQAESIEAWIEADECFGPILIAFQAPFQAQNLGLAARALFMLFKRLADQGQFSRKTTTVMPSSDMWQHAIQLAAATKLPGRLEVLKQAEGKIYIFDGSHTVNSVAAAIEYAQKTNRSRGGRLFILFSLAAGKKMEEIVTLLAGSGAQITVTSTGSFKKSDPQALFDYLKSTSSGAKLAKLEPDPGLAFAEISSSLKPNDTLLVCGSFYLLGAVLSQIKAIEASYVT